MSLTIVFLLACYVLSQFYRVFLAVLTPDLARDLGMGSEDLAISSGLWFAAFAMMQIPVGAALDRFGPRWTTAVLLGVGGSLGAALFATAATPLQVHLAMICLGLGCAPVLMSGYYVIAHAYRPAMFSILAATLLGVGSLGNILGAAPMAAAAAAFGWRATLWGLAAITLVVGLGMAIFARDPVRPPAPEGGPKGSLLDVLRNPAFLLMLPIAFTNNAASADIRGLWAGPWAGELHGADAMTIGHVTLAMSIAMIAGTFAYGPADRLFGSHKRVVMAGNLCLAGVLAVLAFAPGLSLVWGAVLLAAVGFFGSTFPVVVAHGRQFFPPHLVGRGMTMVNLLAIGGVAVAQFGTGPIYRAAEQAGGAAHGFSVLFLFFLIPLVLALIPYAFARDKAGATH